MKRTGIWKLLTLTKLRLKGITSHWWLLQMRGNPLWVCWNCSLLWHYLQWWIWPMTRTIFVSWVKAYIYLVHNRGYIRVIGLPTHPTLVSSVWYQCSRLMQGPGDWMSDHLLFIYCSRWLGPGVKMKPEASNLWHATYHIVFFDTQWLYLSTTAMA
jgi:hypothetical protein